MERSSGCFFVHGMGDGGIHESVMMDDGEELPSSDRNESVNQ